MKKITTSKKSGKATIKSIGNGCAALTLSGELGELAAKVAECAGVTPDAAVRMALESYLDGQAGLKAVFIPEASYRHLEQIAQALNQDKWSGSDNTAQSVFSSFVLDRELADDPAQVMQGIIEGLDYSPETEYSSRTKKDEEVMRRRRATLTRRAATIKWE